jgi:hypothetical protein
MAIMTHVLVMIGLRLYVMPKNAVNDNVLLDQHMRLRSVHIGRGRARRAKPIEDKEQIVRETLATMTETEIQALLDEIAADAAQTPATAKD